MDASVAEIHAYPPRPGGFEEPLFPTRESRRVVAEHLLRAPWLSRASELVVRAGSCPDRGGRTAQARREPVEFEGEPGRVRVFWTSSRRGRRKRRLVVEVLDRWREVGRWWDEAGSTDRSVFRVLLSCGSVVDLARERAGGWFLVGVED